MDIDTIKTSLAEKQAARERVAAEFAEVRASLATVSRAAQAAAMRAEEESLFAVINATPEAQAKAEEAKRTLATAYERETALRDRLPLLDRAVRVLDDEIAALEARLPSAADAKVRDVLTAKLDEIDAELVAVTAKLHARAKALGALHFDIEGVVVDRLKGNGSRPGLRQRVIDAAAQVRAEIVGA